MNKDHRTRRWTAGLLFGSPILILFFASASGSPQQIAVTPAGSMHLPLIAKDSLANHPAPTATAEPSPTPEVTYRLIGLDFSPYMDGQDPGQGPQVSEEQIRERLTIIQPYTQWVRSFSCSHGLEKIGQIAHEMNLKVAAGAWLSKDLSQNNQEVECLIKVAQEGFVDLAVVGSEVLLRKDLTENQLIGYIDQVKKLAPANVPVTTADVYSTFLEHPNVVSAVDVLFANIYPYWEGIGIDYSIAYIDYRYRQLAAIADGKLVIVSEAGWPSCRNQIGNAVPSPENASYHFLNFVSWARANNVTYFYFEAFDETWKALYEGPQGACWGIWDKDGIMKPGMQAIFDGVTVPDNWSDPQIPGGPGEPAIEFTSVPLYGSQDDIYGQVLHVKLADLEDYRVVVYIRVSGGWWIKPYVNTPLTPIRFDGAWRCDITTGGVDPTATEIAAYLVPSTYSPPILLGSSTLPVELDSFPNIKATRSP